MSQSLKEIAQQLKDADKKVQLIYAFNGTGKTRLSREFKQLIAPRLAGQPESSHKKILYYNAFTEDLFYWDNDLDNDAQRKLKIHPNAFTKWVFEEQGQDQNIIANFQRYTNKHLTPHFSENFSEVTFSLERGDDESSDNLKIAKGEESNFIWSIFYTLLDQVVNILNDSEVSNRETNQFDQLEHVFIDDPVTSLDENYLIELAVNLASLIKSSKSKIKFIITTHNPLFYNVLYNELKAAKKYTFKKFGDGTYRLDPQDSDSPFSYHLYLMAELKQATENGKLYKYHFNFLRNVLEKTATFLGYKNWGDLLPPTDDGRSNLYEARVINISNHSKHSGEEVTNLTEDDKRILGYLVKEISEKYHFKQSDD